MCERLSDPDCVVVLSRVSGVGYWTGPSAECVYAGEGVYRGWWSKMEHLSTVYQSSGTLYQEHGKQER